MCEVFSPDPPWGPERGKICQRGFQRTSFSYWKASLAMQNSSADQKATATILYDFHVCKWKNAYTCIKDLNALRTLMNFLCIYIGEGKGCTNTYILVKISK